MLFQEMMTNLRAVHKEKGGMGSVESLSLDKATFKNVLKENIVLITRALRHQFVIPDFQDFTRYIEDFYWKCKQNTGGNVATYIPQLAKYSPDFWGVSICTVDGQRFSLGRFLRRLSFQLLYSISQFIFARSRGKHTGLQNA